MQSAPIAYGYIYNNLISNLLERTYSCLSWRKNKFGLLNLWDIWKGHEFPGGKPSHWNIWGLFLCLKPNNLKTVWSMYLNIITSRMFALPVKSNEMLQKIRTQKTQPGMPLLQKLKYHFQNKGRVGRSCMHSCFLHWADT